MLRSALLGLAALVFIFGGAQAEDRCICHCYDDHEQEKITSDDPASVNADQSCINFCSGHRYKTYSRTCSPVSKLQVDYCTAVPPPSNLPANATFRGNDQGLSAHRAGTSCFEVPKVVSRVRAWCYVWVENNNNTGFCSGLGTSSCGAVSYFDRKKPYANVLKNGNTAVCVDVDNQESAEVRHFILLGEPY
jgi:hypothetical protein